MRTGGQTLSGAWSNRPVRRAGHPVKEIERLKVIADELHRLADEATERYRAALARAEEPRLPLGDD